MTTLKELVIICDPQEIFNLLYTFYKEEDLVSYAKVLDILLDLIPEKTKFEICIDASDESNYNVFGRISGNSNRWDLSLISWSEWLSMNIQETCEAMFDKYEILCHCLVNMTTFGFDQSKIDNIRKDFIRRIELSDDFNE